MKILSEYIAPWALCNEGIPIHLVWEPDFEYDCIRIHTPPEIVVSEFFNVESYEKKNSEILVNSLKTPNFFGFVASSVKTIENQHEIKTITVESISKNEAKYRHTFTANLYRPKLALVEGPKSVALTDDTDLQKLVNVSLKISGFGRIQIRTEVSSGGEFVSRAEPLYREIIQRMISTFKLGEPTKEEKGIQINPLYIQETAKSFIEKMEKGEFPLNVDKEDLKEFKTWLEQDDTRNKLMDMVSRHVENLLIDSLLFYFERHPTDNVDLIQGKPVSLIERATQQISIRFRYRDSVNNEYEPLLVKIPIEDARTEKAKETKIEIPINIKWSEELINPIEVGV